MFAKKFFATTAFIALSTAAVIAQTPQTPDPAKVAPPHAITAPAKPATPAVPATNAKPATPAAPAAAAKPAVPAAPAAAAKPVAPATPAVAKPAAPASPAAPAAVAKPAAPATPVAAPAAPAKPAVAAPAAAATTGKKINLNTATADELDKLPQIGPARAKAIIEARGKAKFKSWDDFVARNVVPSNAEGAIKDLTAF